MISDCNSPDWDFERDRSRVFVDGIEIHGVNYADTDAGFVRTLYVTEDAQPLAAWSVNKNPDLRARGEREGWDMPFGGVVSKIIRGKVELKPWE